MYDLIKFKITHIHAYTKTYHIYAHTNLRNISLRTDDIHVTVCSIINQMSTYTREMCYMLH